MAGFSVGLRPGKRRRGPLPLRRSETRAGLTFAVRHRLVNRPHVRTIIAPFSRRRDLVPVQTSEDIELRIHFQQQRARGQVQIQVLARLLEQHRALVGRGLPLQMHGDGYLQSIGRLRLRLLDTGRQSIAVPLGPGPDLRDLQAGCAAALNPLGEELLQRPVCHLTEDRGDRGEIRSTETVIPVEATQAGPETLVTLLIQEFNREFNTIGSKSGNTELSHQVVDLKSELEKIREQVQNIE